MKHLLGYKLFESVVGETYSSISLNDFNSSVEWVNLGYIKDLRPSERNLDKILEKFPFLNIVRKFYGVILQDRDARFEISIYESDDEWFYLGIRTGTSNDHRIYAFTYKCDQLQGVFDCISYISDVAYLHQQKNDIE